ncbi:ashwin [Gastrophryne carolinensis]
MARAGGSAAAMGQDCDLLLHPELLSRDFLLLSLEQKNIAVENGINDKEKLTEMFVQHALPLPQRSLPKSRWGKMMESKRGDKKHPVLQKSCSLDSTRKRPLIVFDGSSTNTTIKLKRMENGEAAQRLQPLPTERTTSTPVRTEGKPTSPVSPITSPSAKVVISSNNGQQGSPPGANVSTVKLKTQMAASAVKIKRNAPKEEAEGDLKPTEAKKKITHVTWP